jgi:hypothetical protein
MIVPILNAGGCEPIWDGLHCLIAAGITVPHSQPLECFLPAEGMGNSGGLIAVILRHSVLS